MPLMDYKCEACAKTQTEFFWPTEERIAPVCCGVEMAEDWRNTRISTFRPIHLKHVEPGGRTFTSRSELQRYAKERNLELGALL